MKLNPSESQTNGMYSCT